MKTILLILAFGLVTALVSFSQTNDLLAQLKVEILEDVKFRTMEMPSFEGGEPALASYVISKTDYPKIPFKQRVEGTILVKFRIAKNGKILNPSISEGIHPDLDRAALRIVSQMPNWKPAKKNGIPKEVS